MSSAALAHSAPFSYADFISTAPGMGMQNVEGGALDAGIDSAQGSNWRSEENVHRGDENDHQHRPSYLLYLAYLPGLALLCCTTRIPHCTTWITSYLFPLAIGAPASQSG